MQALARLATPRKQPRAGFINPKGVRNNPKIWASLNIFLINAYIYFSDSKVLIKNMKCKMSFCICIHKNNNVPNSDSLKDQSFNFCASRT